MLDQIKNATFLHNGTSSSVNVLKLVQFSFYAFSGLSAVVTSLVIILTTCLNKSLRNKDFFLLAGLAGSDFIRGYGYLHGGILRLVFVSTQTENIQITPSECMKQIYQTFMLFGQQCSPLMVLILSIDRFLAVAIYAKYRRFGKTYSLVLVGLSYTFCCIVTMFAWLSALTMMPPIKVARTCKTETVTPLPYFTFHVGTRCIPGLISIVFYVVTVILLKKKSSTGSGMRTADRKREIRLTKNVLLISMNTILFMTFPFGYTFLSFTAGLQTSQTFDVISPFLWSLSLFGASANLFIYSWKYELFRKALTKCCERKPRVQVAPIGDDVAIGDNFHLNHSFQDLLNHLHHLPFANSPSRQPSNILILNNL